MKTTFVIACVALQLFVSSVLFFLTTLGGNLASLSSLIDEKLNKTWEWTWLAQLKKKKKKSQPRIQNP